MKHCDVLIVGQGIAGTLLGHELEQRGQRVALIDSGAPNASLTAAGMVNPVVLKRFSPVWQGREQILRARQVVADIGDKFAVKLDYPFDIFRIFNNRQERETWANKAAQLDGLLDPDCYPSPAEKLLAPYGVGKVKLGGRIDLHALLSHYRQYWQTAGNFLEEIFDYQRLALTENRCVYTADPSDNTNNADNFAIEARYVVFCEGYGLKQNPYFNHLPLNGNKGEVLTVRIPNLKLTAAVKSSVFIMPLPEQGDDPNDDVYFIGATYNWTDKDTTPTEAGKAELLKKLQKILPPAVCDSIEVLRHNAGMRPTVADRRPLLGRHEAHHNLFVFNGLGTRGVMLGATMAKHLADFILDDIALPPAVDIARFI